MRKSFLNAGALRSGLLSERKMSAPQGNFGCRWAHHMRHRPNLHNHEVLAHNVLAGLPLAFALLSQAK